MIKMIAFLAAGMVLDAILRNWGIDLADLIPFTTLSTAILAVGLYGSVYGIDTKEARQHQRIIVSAVTFGVLLKSAIIGMGLYWLMKSPVAFLFGVTVAQIDPVAVSALLEGKKDSNFSSAGQTILRAWSSFDDPMTVLLGLYIMLPLVTGELTNPLDYFVHLGYNLGFAGVVYGASRHLQEKGRYALLAASFLVAISFNLLLGIAVIGLFLRPPIDKMLSKAVMSSFYLATFLLGSMVVFSITSLQQGVVLGILAVVAQLIAAMIVAKRLPWADRLHLACAQYNGITAISLALFLQAYVPSIGGVIAIAVILINCLYYVTNGWLHRVTKPSTVA